VLDDDKSLLVSSSSLLGCEISVQLVMTAPIVTLTRCILCCRVMLCMALFCEERILKEEGDSRLAPSFTMSLNCMEP